MLFTATSNAGLRPTRTEFTYMVFNFRNIPDAIDWYMMRVHRLAKYKHFNWF